MWGPGCGPRWRGYGTSQQIPGRGEWYFFFQAEDGIRDSSVTGVQTCALPILLRRQRGQRPRPGGGGLQGRRTPPREGLRRRPVAGRDPHRGPAVGLGEGAAENAGEIGRASCRERV